MSTPQQYLDLQKKYSKQYGKKTIVIMEIGSFYEMYGIEEDGGILKEIAELLNIALTKRDKKVKEVNTKNPYLVGFTAISISKYLRVLLNHNYTVVRVDQVTQPPNPKRKVTKIYSPSTAIDEYELNDTNYMMCLFIESFDNEKMCIGISLLDVTTGNSILYEIYDSKNKTDKHLALQEAYRIIHTFHPKEIIIYAEKCSLTKDNIINYLEIDSKIYYFYDNFNHTYKKLSYQNEFLSKIFQNTGLITPIEYLDLERYEYIRISYLLLLQFAYEHDSTIINNINKPVIYEKQHHLILSNNSIQQLNLVNYEQKESSIKYNSLFQIINQCNTIIGKRYLRTLILNPILNIEELTHKYNQIDEMRKDKIYLKYSAQLKHICDLERIQRKLSLCLLHPFEFVTLDASYERVCSIIDLWKNNHTIKYDINEINELMKYYKNIFDIDEMHKYSLKDLHCSFFNKGHYPEIDKLQEEMNTNLTALESYAKYLSDFIDKEGKCAKLEKTDKEGYYIFITNKRFELLKKKCKDNLFKTSSQPSTHSETSTHSRTSNNQPSTNTQSFEFDKLKIKKLNNNVKLTCPVISAISNQIMKGKEHMRILMKEAYNETCQKIYEKFSDLMKKITNAVGNIDVIVSNAKCADLYNYTRPNIMNSSKSYIKAKQLRHPITERISSDTEYVPNDIELGIDEKDGMIITGLNGVGKSVLIKMVATSIIMAQSGMFVPATEFEYAPYNHIISRIGNTDNILKGQSTFVKEMMELSTILKRSNENTLIIADELCSGSEYMSAQAILASTIITLAKYKSSFMFTTHLHGIMKIEEVQNIKNIDFFYLDVTFDSEKDILIYHRKLQKGCSDTLYGIEVSKYIIHDTEFIAMANNIRSKLTNTSTQILAQKSSKYNTDVFMDKCKICDSIDNLDTHHIEFQCNANDIGFINHKHKNVKSNLVVLCKNCHIKTHNDEIIINGWMESTDKGKYLDYEIVKKKKKKSRKKYNEDQVEQINSIKSEFLTPKIAVDLIKHKFDINISSGLVKKMWNGDY
ncbi:hypothetical protein N9T73_00235 [bacterium]|nr:hypothetical protein [bacterium]